MHARIPVELAGFNPRSDSVGEPGFKPPVGGIEPPQTQIKNDMLEHNTNYIQKNQKYFNIYIDFLFGLN